MKQSILSRIVPLYFRMQHHHSEAELRETLAQRRLQPEPEPLAPKGIAYRRTECASGKVFYLNEQSRSNCTVFYLHGGAYWHDFSPFHWRYLKKLIRLTDAAVIAPAYRLAPYGTTADAFELIVPLYESYRREHPEQKVILMGDSAGGGLALALAEHFHAHKIAAPDELILFSPWVDVTMGNPELKAYAPRDPWLTLSLRVPGMCFGGELDPGDYRINPIHGDVSGLKHVLLIMGTRELLYPDLMLLWERLKTEPTNELLIGSGMLHVYPLIPIPEANEATERAAAAVLRQQSNRSD